MGAVDSRLPIVIQFCAFVFAVVTHAVPRTLYRGGTVMHWSRMRKYRVLASKGFIQNLQYTASHLVNSVASAVFGVLEVFLWLASPLSRGSAYIPLR